MSSENTKPVKRNKAPYVALALLLALTVGGIVLILGRAMDVNGMVFTLKWSLCTLPFMFAFPVYIAIEFISLKVNGPEAALLPYPQTKHERTVRVSFVITAVSVLVGIVLLIIFASDAQIGPITSTVMTVPGMLLYCGLEVHECFKKEEDDMIHAIAFLAFLSVFILVETFGIITILAVSVKFSLAFFLFPLTCLVMAMAGRKED
ncbi:MAG: hypothetical protein K6E59_05140 [Bacilli bacterium]|nr:hypothetical protein [Bacilli bacterium]